MRPARQSSCTQYRNSQARRRTRSSVRGPFRSSSVWGKTVDPIKLDPVRKAHSGRHVALPIPISFLLSTLIASLEDYPRAIVHNNWSSPPASQPSLTAIRAFQPPFGSPFYCSHLYQTKVRLSVSLSAPNSCLPLRHAFWQKRRASTSSTHVALYMAHTLLLGLVLTTNSLQTC